MRLVSSQRLTPSAAVIILSGDLDLATAAELRNALQEALTERANLILDMSDLRFLDSTGIGVLVRIHKKAAALSGVLAFAEVPGNVVKILEVTCLDRIFPVYPTVADALHAISPAPEPPTAEE